MTRLRNTNTTAHKAHVAANTTMPSGKHPSTPNSSKRYCSLYLPVWLGAAITVLSEEWFPMQPSSNATIDRILRWQFLPSLSEVAKVSVLPAGLRETFVAQAQAANDYPEPSPSVEAPAYLNKSAYLPRPLHALIRETAILSQVPMSRVIVMALKAYLWSGSIPGNLVAFNQLKRPVERDAVVPSVSAVSHDQAVIPQYADGIPFRPPALSLQRWASNGAANSPAPSVDSTSKPSGDTCDEKK